MSSPTRRKYSFQTEKFTQLPPAPKADKERERRYSHADIYDLPEKFYDDEDDNEDEPKAKYHKKFSSPECSSELHKFRATKAAAPRLSLATSEQQITLCRICLLASDEENNRLIKPCECKGTMGLVHRSCLRKWVTLCNKYYCELCGYHYITEERQPSLMQWMRAILLKRFLKDLLITVILFIYVILGCLYCASQIRQAGHKNQVTAEPSNQLFGDQVGYLSLLLLQVAVLTLWILSILYTSSRSFQKFRQVKRRRTIRQPGSLKLAIFSASMGEELNDQAPHLNGSDLGPDSDKHLSPTALSIINEQMETPQSYENSPK